MMEQYFLSYNKENIFKNLIQAEDHLKNLDEEGFNQCALKHLSFAEAEADEAVSHSMIFIPEKTESFKTLKGNIKKVRREVQEGKADPERTTMKVRKLRRQFESFNEDYDTSKCKSCGELGEKIPKDLNNNPTFNNYQLNKNKDKMAKIAYGELAGYNVGQFAAEGVRYLLGARPPSPTIDKVITIGGGVALQALGLFLKKPPILKSVALIAGSNLFAGGVVKLVKGAVAPAAAVAVVPAQGVGGYAGKTVGYAPVAGGPVFKGRVTATGIPTQYTRASVLAGAQAYSAPEHADLIRVD